MFTNSRDSPLLVFRHHEIKVKEFWGLGGKEIYQKLTPMCVFFFAFVVTKQQVFECLQIVAVLLTIPSLLLHCAASLFNVLIKRRKGE